MTESARDVAAELLDVLYDEDAPIDRRAEAGRLWLELVPQHERGGYGASVFVVWMAAKDRAPGGAFEGKPLLEWEQPTRPADEASKSA